MGAQNPGLLVKAIPCHAGNQTATSASIAIDTFGFGEVAFVYQFGTTTTGTSGTVTLSLSECATVGGTYAAISGATTAALVPDTGGLNAKRYLIHLKQLVGRLRFIKADVTIAGTAAATGATGPLNNAGVLMAGMPNKTLAAADFLSGGAGAGVYDAIVVI